MIVRRPYELPQEKKAALQHAIRLEWWTLFFLATIVVGMYLTMGNSQAMKTAWIEDMLSMIPPVLFLFAIRFHDDDPTAKFPYGKRRTVMLAFLGASLALLTMGAYMFYEGVMKLVMMEHPTIGTMNLLGESFWMGWSMIAVLVYSMIPPVILGHMKLQCAKALHEKTLHADADMNKADWMTAGAAILGILGIGLGFWWADSVAASLIAADIVRDGWKNVRRSVTDLIDNRPTTADSGSCDEIEEMVRERLRELPWVRDADVRLRDEGHVVAGEAYVVPASEDSLVARLREADETLKRLHWRVCDIVVVPLSAEDLRERQVSG